VITNTGKILHTSTTDEYDRVFLKIVAFAGNVGDDFLAVGETYLGDFAKRRVGLLRCTGHYLYTDAAALRTFHERR